VGDRPIELNHHGLDGHMTMIIGISTRDGDLLCVGYTERVRAQHGP